MPATRPAAFANAFGAAAGGGFSPIYWDTTFGSNLYDSLFYYQLGSKRKVPLNNGLVIKIPRLKRQRGVVANQTSASWGAPIAYSALAILCSQNVSGTLTKFEGAYGHSDLTLLTSIGDPIELALRDIARDMAFQMDSHCRTKLSAHGVGVFTGTSGAMVATSVLKPVHLARATSKAESYNNPRPSDGNFPVVLHPLQAYDVMATLSTNGIAFTSVNQYATDRTVEQIYRGEVGRLFGARIVTSTNVKRLVGVGGMSAGQSGYQGLLVAPEAFYVVESDGMTARTIVKPLGSAGAGDPTNSLATVGAKVFFTCIPGFQQAAGGNFPAEFRLIRIVSGQTAL